MENDQSCGRSGQKKQELEALKIQGLEVKIVRQVTILEGHHRLKGSQANYTAFLFLYFFPKQFTVGVLNATLDLAASVLVGVVGFVGSEVVLSPVVSGFLPSYGGWVLVGVAAFLGSEMVVSLHVGGGSWLVWPHLKQNIQKSKSQVSI